MARGTHPALRYLVIGLLGALLSQGAALGAGHPATDPADPWDRVRQIAPGRKIEIQLFHPPRSKVKGTFVSASDDTITVRQKDSRETVMPKADIRKVKLRGSRGKNALLGLAIGGGVGFVIGSIADRGASDDPPGKLILGGLGVVAGSLVGALRPASKTVYGATGPTRPPQACGRQALPTPKGRSPQPAPTAMVQRPLLGRLVVPTLPPQPLSTKWSRP